MQDEADAALGNVVAAQKHLSDMRSEKDKSSIFPDRTFRDIGRQVRNLIQTKTPRPTRAQHAIPVLEES
ncbi:MAG TPA: hypothetical protein VFH89_06625 [Sphingomicrobium sp.]|nr:hypothetical protein [Sphingomicrobium sp.]